MTFLHGFPAGLVLISARVISIVSAAVGQVLVHRSFRSQDFIAPNEVGVGPDAWTGALARIRAMQTDERMPMQM